jgi:hypothetical protein
MAKQAAQPITMICPNLRCRSILQVPEQARGRTVRCGCCGKNFIVPKKGDDSKAPASVKPKAEEE